MKYYYVCYDFLLKNGKDGSCSDLLCNQEPFNFGDYIINKMVEWGFTAVIKNIQYYEISEAQFNEISNMDASDKKPATSHHLV